MFTPSVHLYDTIYLSRGKNYAAEADSVHQLVQHNLRSGGNSLLDIACGTGLHTSYLREHYQVEGLDLDARMLEAAKQKCPDVIFHLGDMRDFDAKRRFALVTIPFRPISHVIEAEDHVRLFANMRRHLAPKGRLVFA